MSDRREMRAEAAAEKARLKAMRPWYRKKRFILPIAFLALVVVLALAAGGDDTRDRVATGSGEGSRVVRAEATRTTEAERPTDIEILNKGFTQLKPGSIGNSYLSYAAVLRNPNADQMAQSVRVNLTFYDGAGTVVKSASDTVAVILPGQTAAVGDSTAGANAARVEVQALVTRWEKVTSFGTFSAEGVTTRPQSYGGLKTNATLASTFAKDLKDVKAVAVYYGPNGAVTGGSFTFVDFVPAGGRIGVELTSSHTVPAARTDVFTVLTNLALVG